MDNSPNNYSLSPKLQPLPPLHFLPTFNYSPKITISQSLADSLF